MCRIMVTCPRMKVRTPDGPIDTAPLSRYKDSNRHATRVVALQPQLRSYHERRRGKRILPTNLRWTQ